MSEVRIGLKGRNGTVLVDGVDVSAAVQSLTLNADARRGGRVILDLPTLDIVVDGEATIGIPRRTHDALVALGWKPPEVCAGGCT